MDFIADDVACKRLGDAGIAAENTTLGEESAANSSLNPGRNSSSSFSVGHDSGSMILRHHFPNRVKACLSPSAIA